MTSREGQCASLNDLTRETEIYGAEHMCGSPTRMGELTQTVYAYRMMIYSVEHAVCEISTLTAFH